MNKKYVNLEIAIDGESVNVYIETGDEPIHIVYWTEDEWLEDAKTVVPAINNAMYLIYGRFSNYFYTEHPEAGTPLEWMWNWGKEYIYGSFKINYVYVFCMMLLFPLVTYLWYRVAKAFKKAE